MRIISKKAVKQFKLKHPGCALSLQSWYTKISYGSYETLHQLRKTFPTADVVGKYTIFNIGGNNFRLITAIHYNTKTVYIRELWTHSEYSQKNNQNALIKGIL